MSETVMRKWKWFWAWQDGAEEAWLRHMSQQGWHLSHPGLAGFYTFTRGEPKDYVYRLDFKSALDKDTSHYLQLFADAGWEHVGELGGWQYFRTESKDGEAPEIYTDNESKVQKYRRLLIFLLILSLPVINAITSERLSSLFGIFLEVMLIAIGFIYAYAIIRLLLLMRRLRRY